MAPPRQVVRWLTVVGGILLFQAVLYGPSLMGRKVLLPMDVLAEPGMYLPTSASKQVQVRHTQVSDLVTLFEPARRFAVSEIHSGRFPSWAPYEYCGVPFIWPRFSPFLLLETCTKSPVILAWAQAFAALIAGVGAYLFFCHVLRVNFWLAAIGSWCYPLTAFFVFWAGYPTGLAVYWLPWILLAVYYAVQRPASGAPLGLALVTCLVLVSGHLDVAGQVLLVSGLFALWCLIVTYGRAWLKKQAFRSGAVLVLAWFLGFLLASPYILPAVEYSKDGLRMGQRASGEEERPPVGLSALPQVLLPDMYGSRFRMVATNQFESSAAAYVGIVATLFAAPLAFCSRRHRSASLCFSGLALFSLSWCLNLPGFVQVLRLRAAGRT